MIYTKFWYDDYISSLNAKEKLLFIYLISNEKVNICGIYEIPDKYILLDTGLNQKELSRIKEKFINDDKFAFINSWVKIINFESYNKFTGNLNETAKEKELEQIPKKIKEYRRGIDRVSAISDTLINHNHNNNKLIINNIIEYLNLKAKKSFRSDSKIAVKNIQARLNENYTLEDFKKVVDIKFTHWFKVNKSGELEGVVIVNEKGVEQDMSQYFNPDTLFGNKFEKYLNQNKSKEAVKEAVNREQEWEKQKEKREKPIGVRSEDTKLKTHEILKDVIPKYRDKLNL